jgi:hypothetical protein
VHGKQRNIYVHIYSSFFCTLARITHPIEDFIRNVPFYFTNIISESFIWDGNDIPSYLTTAWGWVDVLHELLVVFLPHVHGLLSWESRLVSSHQSNVHASHRPAPSKPNAPLSLSLKRSCLGSSGSCNKAILAPCTTPWRRRRRCSRWRRAHGGRTASSGSSAPIKGNAVINSSTLSCSRFVRFDPLPTSCDLSWRQRAGVGGGPLQRRHQDAQDRSTRRGRRRRRRRRGGGGGVRRRQGGGAQAQQAAAGAVRLVDQGGCRRRWWRQHGRRPGGGEAAVRVAGAGGPGGDGVVLPHVSLLLLPSRRRVRSFPWTTSACSIPITSTQSATIVIN